MNYYHARARNELERTHAHSWNPCAYNNNSAPERLDLYITPLASDSTVGARNLAQRRVYMSTAMLRARN